jgi:hypothetical protein
MQGTLSGVSPPHRESHLANSPSGIVDVLHPPIGKSVPLGSETLLWIDEVAPLPWLTEEANQQWS